MSPTEVFNQLSLWIVNLYLKSFPFFLYFIVYSLVWIRIHKAPEYNSNTDPDLQHCIKWVVMQKNVSTIILRNVCEFLLS